MKWIIPALVLMAAIACNVNRPAADQGATTASGGHLEGKSYLKTYTDANGFKIREIRNHNISPHTAMLTDIPNELILETTSTIRHFVNHDSCAPGKLQLNFYKTHEDSLVLYRAYSTIAGQYQFISNSRDVFETTSAPCGGRGIGGQLFSLYTSHPLINFHQYYNEITLPQTDVVRYAGFQPYQSYQSFQGNAGDPQLVGILYYSSKHQSLAKVRIRIPDERLLKLARQNPPKVFVLAQRGGNTIRRRDMDVYPDQGEDYYAIPTNFSLEINFVRQEALPPLVIPVVNDELKLDQVKEGPYKLEKLD